MFIPMVLNLNDNFPSKNGRSKYRIELRLRSDVGNTDLEPGKQSNTW